MSASGLLGAVPAWHERGLCQQTDPESFYPAKGESAEPAKAICRRCPVETECLQWALDRDEQFGVWGGKSEKERRELKRASRQEVAA